MNKYRFYWDYEAKNLEAAKDKLNKDFNKIEEMGDSLHACDFQVMELPKPKKEKSQK